MLKLSTELEAWVFVVFLQLNWGAQLMGVCRGLNEARAKGFEG